MPDPHFVTFQRFNNQPAALAVGALLQEHQIAYQLENNATIFDPSFAYNPLDNDFRIKLQKEDFPKAEKLLEKIYEAELDSVDENYYLFTFSDAELLEIITKKEEWGQFDFLLAQKLLKERGKEIKPEVVELLKQQRLEALSRPAEDQKVWVMAGYLMAALGGLVGLVIGWHLATHKKTLPNGDIVYGYNPADRKNGKRIMVLGLLILVLWTVAQLWVLPASRY